MPTLEDSVLIAAPQEHLFWLSQDYNQRLLWDKYLRVARLNHGLAKAGKGVEAYCESRKGIGMTVRYVSFNPPQQVAMEMTQGPWVFEKFSGSWRFKEEESGQTRVYFRYNFQAKASFLPKLWLNPVLAWLLRHDLRKRLHCFKTAVETQQL
ncbi:SRPBCC family protein [Nibribacter ruber]|uniref:SRPBCC family protein n=1 Tax=Nibribacter ruber TaxID=2698458 RepID=A0A6P1NT79_9BACT|nr:SRPBCC family protein [Nibribacter ruber]QHL86240.1 SRPBCC family protein [Nibribacter ruber]